MIFKKKEAVAAALVVLIGMAGYLNWSYQDTISVTDGESYIETGKKLGEAQYVSNTENGIEENKDEENEETEEVANTEIVKDDGNYLEQAKLNRETARSRALEILNSTAENESFDSETRKKAGDKIIETAELTERENSVEGIAQSKGYNQICVYCDDGVANIVVKKDGFNDDDVVKLTEIATEALKISSNNVKIVAVQ